MQRLFGATVREVSLVGRGANGKRFLLKKEDRMKIERVKEIIAKAMDGEDRVTAVLKDKGLDEAQVAGLTAAVRLVAEVAKGLPEGLVAEVLKAVDIVKAEKPQTPDLAAILEAIKGTVAKDKEAIEKIAGAIAGLKDKPGPQLLMKADGTPDWEKIPADMQPVVKALWERAEKTGKNFEQVQKELDEERETRRAAERVAKAETFTHVPLAKEKLVGVLKALEALPEADRQEIEGLLDTVQKAVAQGELFKVLGRDGPAPDSAEGKLSAIAKALKEADPKLTDEQAMARALEANPELYGQYMDDRNPARG